jgi:fatty-acyl-CoA synthase
MSLPSSERVDIQETTGHSPFSVQLQITDDDGKVLAWDGKASGKLWARGAAVVNNYHKEDKLAVDKDGWFDTGDVATIDKNGYMRITDRSKDVIKSGGEWISSIELENAAIAHDKVAEAAAIGVAHPKWDERPVIVVVSKEGSKPDPKDIIKKISERVAKWQVPDDVIFMDNIPHTATGKISKMELRNILKDLGYQHPDIKK